MIDNQKELIKLDSSELNRLEENLRLDLNREECCLERTHGRYKRKFMGGDEGDFCSKKLFLDEGEGMIIGEEETLYYAGYSEKSPDNNIIQDVLDTYRKGLEISRQALVWPLIPLYKKLHKKLPVQYEILHQQSRYDFYLVEIVFGYDLKPGQFCLNAGINIELKDDILNEKRKTCVLNYFPERKDITYFKANMEAEVGLDFDMDFSFSGKTVKSLESKAKSCSHFLVGPLSFEFHKTAIEVGGRANRSVFWRYNMSSELSSMNEIRSLLILRVPQEAGAVSMDVDVYITPAKKKWFIFNEKLVPLQKKINLSVELVPSV